MNTETVRTFLAGSEGGGRDLPFGPGVARTPTTLTFCVFMLVMVADTITSKDLKKVSWILVFLFFPFYVFEPRH